MKLKIQLFAILLLSVVATRAQWKPVSTPISTRWGKEVTPENAWQEYPRPQMERDEWLNLNGLWDYAVTSNALVNKPEIWQGKILVPFSIEAPLSGVGKQVTKEEAIWYRRTFSLLENWKSKNLLLNFEASDFETTVWLNEKLLGTHKGGYQPFSMTIDGSKLKPGIQVLTVKVFDPQESVFRSIGKQGSKTSAYERCSGIWQTVWLEPVSEKASISSLKIDTDLKEVLVDPIVVGDLNGLSLICTIFDHGIQVASASAKPGEKISLKIPTPKLWNPDSPFLYDMKVTLEDHSEKIDEVKSYFGMRTILLSKSDHGTNILLNGKPIFQMGPLDQNYWPDGGMTPPSDAAMQWEAEYLKRIGCNMVRSHIKENPERYYYHCDKAGLLVWQDLIPGKFNQKNPTRAESDFWFNEQKQLIKTLYNHPSIVLWVIFNESWSEHDPNRIFEQVKAQDSTRLLSIASGWDDVPGIGDIRDIHDYTFRPAIPALGEDMRAVVLGECGGFASAVPPHNWTGRSNQTGEPKNPLHGGFDPEIPRDNNSKHDIFRPTFTVGLPFEKQYRHFIENLLLLQNSGLRAVVYTQMTDMKLEENGWLSFDREVSKIQPDSLHAIHEMLYTAPPKQKVVIPASKDNPQTWDVATMSIQEVKNKSKANGVMDAFTIQEKPNFESLKWKREKGPFGNTPDLSTGTNWDGKSQLIIKKTIQIDDISKDHSFRIYTKMEGKGTPWMHTRIYLNGEFVADETTRQTNPELRMAEVLLPDEAKKILKKGENNLVVQFVPGLMLKSGKIEPITENVYVDIELTEIEN